LSPQKKKSRQLQRQSRGKENWGSAINLNLLERSGVAHRQRESFLSEPALELEAKRLKRQPKTTAMCSRGGEMITTGSGVDPFGNNDMIHRCESSLAGEAATTTTTNNDAADAVLLPLDEDAAMPSYSRPFNDEHYCRCNHHGSQTTRNYTYTAPQSNLKRHHLLPSEPATKEEVMDFDEDCSSETEFDEDSCSETEFDVDSSSETEFDEDCSSETEIDVDAIDFDGNDTNVYFIVKPFDDAAKKAELILNNTHARMKKQDKGPTTESEEACLVTLKRKFAELFKLGYDLISAKCKCDDLGRHVYEPQPMVGLASKSAGCYKVVQVTGGNNKGRVKTG
jgi:hypothetical protein